MNDHVIAAEFVRVLSSPAFAPVSSLISKIVPAQSGAVGDRPLLSISGEFQPYLAHRKGVLTLELRSRLADETDEAPHQERFQALWTALFGATGADAAATRASQEAAHAALVAAIAAGGKIELLRYGHTRDGVTADVDDVDLRTVIRIALACRFLPEV